ncbi:MAG: cysteinyl-tRNA synthetase [Anaerolineae bacterium]
MSEEPGLVVLFGSGETSASGRRVHDWLMSRLRPPIRVAVLETPAGFQPNSAQVAGRVADFLRHHLQNYHPQVMVVPARKRGSSFSPDDPTIVAPLLQANVIFMGPGSPTYAVRQLQGSLAWHMLVARHRLGAAMILASAGIIALSAYALPVYEIYKAGEELHWRKGLDFFGPYGLSLVFVSHWNNREGGADLDTGRCFMGQVRFEQLLALLPSEANVVGIDEHTALVMDLGAGICRVLGRDGVTLLRKGEEYRFVQGQTFAVTELGPFQMPEPETGIPTEVWEKVQAAQAQAQSISEPPLEVVALVEEREAARACRDWATADALRERIAALGWQIHDTPVGPDLEPLGDEFANESRV